MSKSIIKKSIALDLLSSASLDRLARHRGKTRQQVVAELIEVASRLTTKDMNPTEWRTYFAADPAAQGLATWPCFARALAAAYPE